MKMLLLIPFQIRLIVRPMCAYLELRTITHHDETVGMLSTKQKIFFHIIRWSHWRTWPKVNWIPIYRTAVHAVWTAKPSTIHDTINLNWLRNDPQNDVALTTIPTVTKFTRKLDFRYHPAPIWCIWTNWTQLNTFQTNNITFFEARLKHTQTIYHAEGATGIFNENGQRLRLWIINSFPSNRQRCIRC